LFIEPLLTAAGTTGVEQRALQVRALLQLPRVATFSRRVTRAQIERELGHSARQLLRDTAAAKDLVPRDKFALTELIYAERVDVATASKLFGCLHYLRSARPGSEYFALLDPVQARPVTICGVAPLEWKRVGSWVQAQFGVPRESVWDVARVFSCDTAPPNAVSYLLARVRNSLARSDHDIEYLVTAVDPNLGFTGASYRAANWQKWITINPRPYLYLDRRYVSPRQLKQRFGTSNLTDLKERFPRHHFEQSRARLLDSLIFGCHVKRETAPPPESSSRPLHR